MSNEFKVRAIRYFIYSCKSHAADLENDSLNWNYYSSQAESYWDGFTPLERKRIEEINTHHAQIRFMRYNIGIDLTRSVGYVNGVFQYID